MEHQGPSSTTFTPSNSMLTVAPPITAAAYSQFKLPPGWRIEKVKRNNGYSSDKYYYEPGTGREFRSIREIQRYLDGEEYTTRRSRRNRTTKNQNSQARTMISYGGKNAACQRMIVLDGKMSTFNDKLSDNNLATVAPTNTAPTVLPDGWIVKEVPRKSYSWSDKYYYQPATGMKFRSLVAVQRYLAELEEIKETIPLSKLFKLGNHTKPINSSENTKASSFPSPPWEVSWVLGSQCGNEWKPFISDTSVQDSVKHQWTNRFMQLMSDEIGSVKTAPADT